MTSTTMSRARAEGALPSREGRAGGDEGVRRGVGEDRRGRGSTRFNKPHAAETDELASPTAMIRLSKLLSERGHCSRREADDMIAKGWVLVDGRPVTVLGSRVPRNAKVTLSPEAQRSLTEKMTLVLHKPVGYVSGQPEPGYIPAIRLISRMSQVTSPGEPQLKPEHLDGLAPAGRLDIDSTGVLIFTQDGALAKRLIGQDSEIEKEYIVRVSGTIAEGGLPLLQHGLELDGEPLKPARVEWLNPDQLRFILKEGKKRQIRRMCEAVGLKVVSLLRTRVGAVSLKGLPVGKWRFLKPGEL